MVPPRGPCRIPQQPPHRALPKPRHPVLRNSASRQREVFHTESSQGAGRQGGHRSPCCGLAPSVPSPSATPNMNPPLSEGALGSPPHPPPPIPPEFQAEVPQSKAHPAFGYFHRDAICSNVTYNLSVFPLASGQVLGCENRFWTVTGRAKPQGTPLSTAQLQPNPRNRGEWQRGDIVFAFVCYQQSG